MIEEKNSEIQKRMQESQKQRLKRRTNTWFNRLRLLIKLLTIFCICFAGYKIIFFKYWFLNDNALKIPNKNPYIKIIGNKLTPNYKILQALRQSKIPKYPIYLINVNNIQKEINKIDPIKKVYIRRLWFPARFNIFIEERKPILTIAPNAEVAPIAFFAEGGKLIGREYLPLDKSYKTVLILTYGTKGDDYHYWDEKKVLKLEKLAKTIEAYSKDKLEYIDLRDPKDVYIKLKSVNIRLGEIDSTISKRIAQIPSIMPQIRKLKNEIKYIDIRWEKAPVLKMEYNKHENSADTNKQ